MKTLAPVFLPKGAVVTARCPEGHPTQFARDFGAGGMATCTPLMVEGIPVCSICTPDSKIADALNAGLDVEIEN